MKLLNQFILLLLVLLLLSGCGAGDGSNLDENGQAFNSSDNTNDDSGDGDSDDDGSDKIQPTLASLQAQVFTPICSVCHIGANAPFGLELDTLEHSANNLINVIAGGNASFKRVEPGNKDNSYLYLKVIGEPQAGSRMPLGQSPLSDEAIAAIGAWIEAGADIASNDVSASQAPLFVTEIVQTADNDDAIAVTINFSVDVDPNTLLAEQILLTKNSQLLSIPYDISWQNARMLTININKPIDFEEIMITLNQTSIGTITGKNGQQLDGDRDGWPGGELTYVANF